MKIHKLLMTNNPCYKAGKKITPTGIVVHSTGANNSYIKRYVGPDDGILGIGTRPVRRSACMRSSARWTMAP